ncbi:polyketide synthase [Janthinobacterium sp. LB2P49]|uniref:beta-ketoacyl [acyl carrier protein] synthase domain-containing protein n=1 Tax=Janthinobacterium sp. LB2P49 TaxID=3424198 RepID=UPI003F203192
MRTTATTSSPPMHKPPAFEPIAIIGIGCLYPQARGKDAFWRQLQAGKSHFAPLPLARYWDTDGNVREQLRGWHGAFFDEMEFDFKRFRIPPVYRKSVSQMMLMLLQVADECVRDAGYDKRDLPRDEVAVMCGTCFGFDSTIANALKVEGVRLAHELAGSAEEFSLLKETLRERFGSSSHDRVGEMASSIPARIASFLSLRGPVQAMECADATGYALLEAASLSLHSGQSRAVIVASGQRIESLLTPLALARKGFTGACGGHPFAQDGAGTPMGEGATALLLKRLSDARRDNDRIYSVLRGMGAARQDVPGALAYAVDGTAAFHVINEACAQAEVTAAAQQYIDCVLPGIGSQAPQLFSVLSDACAEGKHRPLQVGASVATFGHTFANAALAAVAGSSLALHEKTLPQMRSSAALHARAGIAYPDAAIPWPGDAPQLAGVFGSSLTGVQWHLLLSAPESASHALSSDMSPAQEQQEPIAIVGIGGAFGPCSNSADFAQRLFDGLDAVQPLPENVLPRSAYFGEGEAGVLSSYAQYGADLKQREYYDAGLAAYKIFPKRAAALDIAQKLTLHVAAEALVDFGLAQKRDKLGRTAVIVASNLSLGRERELACRLHAPELVRTLGSVPDAGTADNGIDHFTLDGYLASGSAALVSACFGLAAMPVAVEAACASSLAVFNNAVLALRRHRYDLVLAGGVELPANLRDLVLCSSQMMLSQQRIAPFAEHADGFSPGDGAALFVLKRLSDALRDGDRIHATITGVGGSADAVSMTAPDPDGQALAMRRAFAQAGYAAASVQYVEAHGTGTRLGDLAELTSIGSVYGGARAVPLRIGSVKSNIGHTFAAAGAAGLLKTVLALQRHALPATLLRRRIDPQLPLAGIPAELVTANTRWDAIDGSRRAAVSSFGTGGINYHLLVQADGGVH